jgi:hypothetical protein
MSTHTSSPTPAHQTVRMVARADGDGYRHVREAEYQRRAGALRLEGVDGDETANTVTYWYCGATDE